MVMMYVYMKECKHVKVKCEFCEEIIEGDCYEIVKNEFKDHILNKHRSEFIRKYANLLKRNSLNWAIGYIFAYSSNCVKVIDNECG